MPFHIDEPVAGNALFGRERDIKYVCENCVETVRKRGQRCFIALIGIRKVGKSSIIHEVKRRYDEVPDIYVTIVDCHKWRNDSDNFFRYYAIQVMNEFLRRQGYLDGVELIPMPDNQDYEDNFDEIIQSIRSLGSEALNRGVRVLEVLQQPNITERQRSVAYSTILYLPQYLAEEASIYFQIIFDEFQEIAKLNKLKEVQETLVDIYSHFRSVWILERLEHRVNYMITGSRLGQLRIIISSPREPLFGHFHNYGIRSLARPDAKEMIEILMSQERFSFEKPEMVKELLDLSDSNPYYIREILQAAATRANEDKIITEDDFRHGVQDAFFSENGTLNGYFAQYFRDYLEDYPDGRDVMISLAEGNTTIEQVAHDLNMPVSAVKKHLEELEYWNAVKNRNIDKYYINNPVFNFWLRGSLTRYKNIAGPFLVGSEAEKKLALFLLEHGIDLVYQAFQSRGPFDLLMEHGGSSVAIQVKKVDRFYCQFSKAAYERMRWYIEQYGRKAGAVCLLSNDVFRFYRLEEMSKTKRGYSINRQTPYTENPIVLL
jgi:AAA+ ATPase superfamily predicted ATPase